MYVATVTAEDGSLVALPMVPLREVSLRLGRAEPSDAEWLAQTLDRICRPYGTHVYGGEQDLLTLGWDERSEPELSKREGGEHAPTRA